MFPSPHRLLKLAQLPMPVGKRFAPVGAMPALGLARALVPMLGGLLFLSPHACCIANTEPAHKQIIELVQQIKNQTDADKALHALSKMGTAARDASPLLVSMLEDPNQLLRRGLILDTLEHIGVNGSAAATLIEVIGQEGKLTQTRLTAIRLLGKTDPPAQEALDVLQDIAQDKTDSAARQAALQATRSIMQRSNHSDEAAEDLQNQIKQLRAAIATGETRGRLDALDQIAKLGADAAPVSLDLLPLLDDPEIQVREATVNAFCSIGPKAAGSTKALTNKLLGASEELQRDQLSRALLAIDPGGRLIVSYVTPALDDPFKARAAVALLDQIGTSESQELAEKARQRWHMK